MFRLLKIQETILRSCYCIENVKGRGLNTEAMKVFKANDYFCCIKPA